MMHEPSLWSSLWPLLALLAGFVALVIFDRWRRR